MVSLLRVCLGVHRRLTVAIVALSVLRGLLVPGLMLATGALVGDLNDGRSATVPLVAIAVMFTVQRVCEPLDRELGDRLWRQVDEALSERVMVAMATPPGLSHVEDPAVLDAAVQAEGALTGTTPGEAAAYLAQFITVRISAAVALLIVAAYKPVLVPLLLAAYLLAFRFTNWHWHQVAEVMHGGTEALRRSFYLRTLALTHTVAKEVRVFGLSDWLVDRYRRSWLAVMTDVWDSRNEAWVRIVGVVLALAGIEVFSLGLLAHDAAGGDIDVGRAAAVAQAMLAAAVLAEFSNFHWSLGESELAIGKLRGLEERAAAATVALHGDRLATQLPTQSIRFEQVSFTYPGRESPVFDGFDLDITVGQSLAIVGENGAGKTTLVKLLARLYDPHAGRILVDGVDLRELDPISWRSRLAPVFQDHLQLEVSAYDNVAFGALPMAYDEVRVERAATLAGAGALIEQLPQGWHTVLSRAFTGGTQLSGGEWQRLALARALFAVEAGAGLVILDEPTAAMDVRGEAEVYDRFLELTRGVTAIVISHRFSTVRRADRIVVVEAGRVIEDGSHAELVARGGRYATMYRLQADRFSENADA